MINEQQKNAIFLVVFSVAIVLLLAWHISISCDYPYYFVWDMDLVTMIDTVLIHSELLPTTIGHPGFGMYLPLFFSSKIAHLFGVLSVLNLEELAASLNPLAAMAELTTFIRLHSPFLSVGIAALLAIAICLMFDMSRWLLLFFFVFLGMQESLTYHSSMVRTELYSVFYWSGAIVTMAMAAKTAGTLSRRVSLLVTGLLLGLCFLTKIQSLFYLAAFMVLLILVFSLFQDSQKQSRRGITRKGGFWILAVSFFNFIAFLILGIASHLTPLPPEVRPFGHGFCITPIAVISFLALLLLFIFQLFLYMTNRLSSDTFRISSFVSVITAGFILSFAFHFLLYLDAGMSLNYALLNFKMLFLRESKLLQLQGGKAQDLSACISGFLLYLYYNPTLFIISIALNLLLVFGYYLGFVRITKGQLVLCLLITILAFVNIVVLTRLILRDILWREVLLNFLNLFYFGILLTRTTRNHSILAKVGIGLLIVLFFVNCLQTYKMPTRITANSNYAGWREDRWFDGVFRANQLKYEAIMKKKYNRTTAWVAKSQSTRYKQIRRIVDFVFENQTVTHRNIGIVFEGFSVWSTDLDYKIAEAPPALKGAILVDNAPVELKRNTFFKEEYVRKKSEYLDKFKKPSSTGLLSVLTRRDLKIFLFVGAGDVSHLVTREIVQTPYKIVLQNKERTIELQGLEIRNYCEIPLYKFSHKFFFVIRKI